MPTAQHTFVRTGPPLTVTVHWDDGGENVRVSHPAVCAGQPVEVPHMRIHNEDADLDAAVAEFAGVFMPPATVEDLRGSAFRMRIRGRPQLVPYIPASPAEIKVLTDALGPPKRTIRLIIQDGTISLVM